MSIKQKSEVKLIILDQKEQEMMSASSRLRLAKIRRSHFKKVGSDIYAISKRLDLIKPHWEWINIKSCCNIHKNVILDLKEKDDGVWIFEKTVGWHENKTIITNRVLNYY